MEFTQFRNNGTIVITFSEDMMDEDNGFNVTILYEEELIRLNISLTQESIDLIQSLRKNATFESMINFTWNVTYFKKKIMLIDIFFDNPIQFS